jgi:chromosome segregation ATPase
MAGTKDLLTKLADAGEEAITRLAKAPGGEQLTHFAHTMRERMDELQRKVRGLEELERRVEGLEKRVDALSKPKPRARAAAKKPAAARSATRSTRTRKSTTGRSTGRTGGSSPG